MAVDENLPVQPGRHIVGGLPFQELSQHFVRGLAGVRMKVVVESIRPQDHLPHLPASVAGSPSHGGIGNTPVASPLLERMRGKARDLPLRSQMQSGTEDLTNNGRIV